MGFNNLGLSPRLLEAVARLGYTEPTPIQLNAIPLALEGRDIVGTAQTGTGKTAAFILPTLQRIQAKPGAVRALVITPTRELAAQIDTVATAVGKVTGHKVASIYGGVGYEPQRKALKRGVDLLVACPGRLLDLVREGYCDLSKVEVLIIDEADRMLDMGFWPDVKRILGHLPEQRQNLLFSATMSPGVLRVVNDTLHDPAEIQVTATNTPIEAIRQEIYPVGSRDKVDLLLHLIKEHNLSRVLVFTRTKHRADRVARVLERANIKGATIHGDRSQAQRDRALQSFRNGKVQVLVATDVVARGIDIDDISHVINYDLPDTPESYTHRIGRTARAGREGAAFTLMAPEELPILREIERAINHVLDTADAEGFDYTDFRTTPDPKREAAPARKPFSSRKFGGRGRSSGYGSKR